jgi:hypothetical protein
MSLLAQLADDDQADETDDIDPALLQVRTQTLLTGSCLGAPMDVRSTRQTMEGHERL